MHTTILTIYNKASVCTREDTDGGGRLREKKVVCSEGICVGSWRSFERGKSRKRIYFCKKRRSKEESNCLTLFFFLVISFKENSLEKMFGRQTKMKTGDNTDYRALLQMYAMSIVCTPISKRT